jgi:hypothetical protein
MEAVHHYWLVGAVGCHKVKNVEMKMDSKMGQYYQFEMIESLLCIPIIPSKEGLGWRCACIKICDMMEPQLRSPMILLLFGFSVQTWFKHAPDLLNAFRHVQFGIREISRTEH